MGHHHLDQVSSQSLARLAAERGLSAAVVPAGEDVVRRRGRSWKRWLPYVFLPLSLFALGGMLLGISSMADDGWSWSDLVQFALMALLVAGVFGQARSVLRPTRVGRWLAKRRPKPAPPPTHHIVLHAVSAEYLVALRPASPERMGALRSARHRGSRWFDRVAVVAVVALATLAFLAMVGVLGWVAYAAGWDDASVWLTAPFTALSGFALWQLFSSARSMSFRGRPFTLVSRAFRDSVRLWGSGSVATKVALTTTATASVAGAAVVPVVVQRDTKLDLFVLDSASGVVFRVDLANDTSSRAQTPDVAQLMPVALGTNPAAVTLNGDRRIAKGSILVVFEGAAQGGQGIVAFPPGSRTAAPVARIEPAIPGAEFAVGEGRLFAVQGDGAFWHVDLRTGAATQVGQLTVAPGPFTYEADSRQLVMVSGGEVLRLEPASGAVLTRNPAPLAPDATVCAIADGPGDLVFVTLEGHAEITVLKGRSGAVEYVRPVGDAPAAPCELTVALRR